MNRFYLYGIARIRTGTLGFLRHAFRLALDVVHPALDRGLGGAASAVERAGDRADGDRRRDHAALRLEFAWTGRGTPAPWDPPRGWSISGLYRWVRNPMYVGMAVF
jgi:hypothetical protein